jgi:hypothetical protein
VLLIAAPIELKLFIALNNSIQVIKINQIFYRSKVDMARMY